MGQRYESYFPLTVSPFYLTTCALKNISKVTTMRIRMQGFVIIDFMAKFAEGQAKLAQWLSEGKLKSKETIIKGGLKAAEGALLQVFEGKNVGKTMVEIKNPEEGSKL